MSITLPPLPYSADALEPHVSSQTLTFHHDKHHAAYVKKTNELIEGTPLADKPLEEIVRATAKDDSKKTLFNNAAQAWNHAFFWKCLAPKGGGKPSGEIAKLADAAFGGADGLKKELAEAASTHFGSGWAWLVLDGGKLKVEALHDAGTPIALGRTPLLAIDVWEHAYYLDYQNRRPDFVKAVLDNLVNWNFAEQNLKPRAETMRA